MLMTDPSFDRGAYLLGKAFLRRLSEFDHRFLLEDLQVYFVAHARANNIARHYLAQEAKITNIDYWLNLPSGNGEEPTSSQMWYRDFEDRRVFKVFVYLTDVDESNGPMSYLSGSQPGGRYGLIFPTPPPLGIVVEDEQLSGGLDKPPYFRVAATSSRFRGYGWHPQRRLLQEQSSFSIYRHLYLSRGAVIGKLYHSMTRFKTFSRCAAARFDRAHILGTK
jgi:hypothetical protein